MKPLPLVELMREQGKTLFAMVDAAQVPDLPTLLSATGAPCRSLFEGDSARNLRDVAPYLVHLGDAPALLQRLLEQGWGHAWASYLSCDLPFDELRRHLRKFLMVKTDDGRQVYFRFYDPRVLRTFLPTCTPEQLKQFFGPITAFWLEAEATSGCAVFRHGPSGLQQETLAVT